MQLGDYNVIMILDSWHNSVQASVGATLPVKLRFKLTVNCLGMAAIPNLPCRRPANAISASSKPPLRNPEPSEAIGGSKRFQYGPCQLCGLVFLFFQIQRSRHGWPCMFRPRKRAVLPRLGSPRTAGGNMQCLFCATIDRQAFG